MGSAPAHRKISQFEKVVCKTRVSATTRAYAALMHANSSEEKMILSVKTMR